MRILLSLFVLATVYAAPASAEGRSAWKIVNLNLGETVNMRAAPTTTSQIVQKVRYNTGIVEMNGDCITKQNYNWCPVLIGDQQGWIADNYLRKVRVIAAPAKVAANLEEPAIAEAPPSPKEKGIFFVYHQKEPKKNPTGCMAVAASKLPPVEELDAEEGAIGKKISKTVCCRAEYVYFAGKSSCKAYIKAKAMPPSGELEPVTIPDEVNNL